MLTLQLRLSVDLCCHNGRYPTLRQETHRLDFSARCDARPLLDSNMLPFQRLTPQIPLAMIGDILINDISVSLMYGAGASLVVVGFLFINYVSYEEHLHSHED